MSIRHSQRTGGYIPLPDLPDVADGILLRHVRDSSQADSSRFKLVIACILTSVSSFVLGALYCQTFLISPEALLGTLRGVPGKNTFLEYNSSFSEPPSPKTNLMWESLYPPQGGFLRHPELSLQRAGMTVFHQLHCLDGLRHSLFSSAQNTVSVHQGDSHDSSPEHIYHCIDYLRQTIMCAADTNLEPRIESLKGVSGFGSVHVCRDFDHVKNFVTKWEAFNQSKLQTSQDLD